MTKEEEQKELTDKLIACGIFHRQPAIYYSVEEGSKEMRTPEGALLIPAIYDKVIWLDPMKACDATAVCLDGKWGVAQLDGKGTLCVPTIYEDILPMWQDQYKVQKDGKWGLIDSDQNVLIPIEMDNIQTEQVLQDDFYPVDHLFVFSKDGKKGLLNSEGVYIAPRYDDITFSDEIHICGEIDGELYFVTTDGSLHDWFGEEPESALEMISDEERALRTFLYYGVNVAPM